MNRATLDDFRKAFSLCVIEIPFDVNIACNLFDKSPVGYVASLAIVGMYAFEIVGGNYRMKWEFFVLAIL